MWLAASVLSLVISAAGTEDGSQARPPSGGDGALRSRIDAILAGAWRDQAIEPAPACDDPTFLRRIFLDLRGRVPRRDEAAAFLADTGRDRRARLVEETLASEDFAVRLAAVYADLLTSGKEQQRPQELMLLRRALTGAIASGSGFDAVVRDLVQASGRSNENPATAFVLAYEGKKDELASVTARSFLGLQIQCAQCHDHPFDHWKQSDFKGFAAFFQGVVARRAEKGSPVFEVSDRPNGPRALQMRKRLRDRLAGGEPPANPKVAERLQQLADWTEPRFLDGKHPDGGAPRAELASWLTSPENPWFAKATVNRFWALLFGRGVVDPVDDLNPKNPPAVAELLDVLARDFVAHGYDLRHLVRELVSSRAYQLDATGAKLPKDAASPLFASYAVKPLGAEQVLRSIGTASDLRGRLRARGRGPAEEPPPAAPPAPEPGGSPVPGAAMAGPQRLISQFRYAFQDDEGEEGEEFAGTIARDLLLMNSSFIQEATAARRGGLLAEVMQESMDLRERLDQLFLATLSRRPAAAEIERFGHFVERAKDHASAYEDVLWALFNSSEFLTNH